MKNTETTNRSQHKHWQLLYIACFLFITLAAGAVIAPNDKGLIQLAKEASPPGAVIAFAGEKPPQGWLLCDGQALRRSDYPALFQAIGTAHGSPGDDLFNLPDFRGVFLRGVSGESKRDPDRENRTPVGPGGSSGNKVGSVQEDQLRTHSHTVDPPQTTTSANGAHAHKYLRPVQCFDIDRGGMGLKSTWSIDSSENGDTTDAPNHTHTLDISPFNSMPFGGTETRPKNAYVHFIIKQ